MSQQSRRFTDREVALVLKKATELDQDGQASGGALSLRDLEEIAAEVGISGTALERAVASLDRGRDIGAGLAGAPLVRKAAHAVPSALDHAAIARLIRVVDEHTDSAGSVSEALGSVRWTASDRFRSTRVSITPGDDETTIEVVEKASPRVRLLFHLLPAAWTLMLAGPLVGAFQLSGAALGGTVAGAVVAGVAVGRGAWSWMSDRSARRVRRLAEGLADAPYAVPERIAEGDDRK
jgi:hypothetical protein